MTIGSELPVNVGETGLTLVKCGAALLTIKVCAVDGPPPGAGFSTMTGKEPALINRSAVMLAVSWFGLTNAVATELPLNFTTLLRTNWLPFNVSVKPPLPAVVKVGLMLVSIGTGFVTVKILLFENRPLGSDGSRFSTVIV